MVLFCFFLDKSLEIYTPQSLKKALTKVTLSDKFCSYEIVGVLNHKLCRSIASKREFSRIKCTIPDINQQTQWQNKYVTLVKSNKEQLISESHQPGLASAPSEGVELVDDVTNLPRSK